MKKIYLTLTVILASFLLLNSCQKYINPAEGTINTFAAVYVVKNAYQGTDVQLQPSKLDGAYLTGGIVISNALGLNFPKGSLVIQNTARGFTRGILIDLGDVDVPFVPGDSILIDLTGSNLTKVGGSLHINGLSLSKISKISSNNKIVTKTVALGELFSNFSLYEGTLVKVIADTKPLPVTGETYAGNKILDDGSGNSIILHTQVSATFAGNKLPASATYIGIPVYGNSDSSFGEEMQLRLRTIVDVENASGPIYPNWPESFEGPDALLKSSYNMNTATIPNNSIELKTGNWKLEQAIVGNLNANRDRFNAPGIQCIRIQQNLTVPGYVQMNFDLPNGASKVTLWQGAYSTDAVSTWKLEYSTDGGTTWIAAIATGNTIANIQTLKGGSKQETFLFDISGPVRFRVNKLGLGVTSVPNVLNGRLCIEDFAIYSN